MEGKNMQLEFDCVKNSDFIDFTNFEVGLDTFVTDVLIVSATSRHYSVLWHAGRFRHEHFNTECQSKCQFGSLIRHSWLRL